MPTPLNVPFSPFLPYDGFGLSLSLGGFSSELLTLSMVILVLPVIFGSTWLIQHPISLIMSMKSSWQGFWGLFYLPARPTTIYS